MYIFGGSNEHGPQGDIYSLDLEKFFWSKVRKLINLLLVLLMLLMLLLLLLLPLLLLLLRLLFIVVTAPVISCFAFV
jgi:hypothetical protein